MPANVSPNPFFSNQEIPRLSQKSHLIKAYISWSIRQAGTSGDGGRCLVASQQRNGYTVPLILFFFFKEFLTKALLKKINFIY